MCKGRDEDVGDGCVSAGLGCLRGDPMAWGADAAGFEPHNGCRFSKGTISTRTRLSWYKTPYFSFEEVTSERSTKPPAGGENCRNLTPLSVKISAVLVSTR
jgi:hypothetical protein